MFKMIKIRELLALLLLVCLFAVLTLGWGFNVHRMITRVAINRLPPESLSYFEPITNEVIRYSTYPDEHRTEPNAHFMEIDFYGNYPFSAFPYSFKEAVKKYGETTVISHGWVPWAVKKYYDKLVAAIATHSPNVAKYAGMMAHFAEDLHMPLHATENFDGQLTGQSGIHALWESIIVDKKFTSSMIGSTKVSAISDIVKQCFYDVIISWRMSKILLSEAKKTRQENELWEKTKTIAASQITRSVWMVSSLLNMAYLKSKSYVSPKIEKPEIIILKISPLGENEFIAIKNVGKSAVNLKEWRIISSCGKEYVFGNFVLQPNRYVIVHSGPKARGIIWTKSYIWPDSSGEAKLYSQGGDLEYSLSY